MRNIRAIPHSMLAGALSMGLLFAAGSVVAAGQSTQAPEKEEKTRTESSQPVNDTWITTKVKTELGVAENADATDIKVETTNGVVKLSGKVDSQAEINKAESVAKGVDGVKKVDKSGLVVGKD